MAISSGERRGVSGAWVFATVDDTGNVGRYNAVAADKAGHGHISYADTTNSTLKYMTNASGAWVASTISNERAWENAIAVDSAGKIHIAYHKYIVYNSDLHYVTNVSGAREVTPLRTANDTGQSPAIAVDGNDKVHISFYNKAGGNLYYATDATGEWEVSGTVDEWSADTGEGTSITVDGKGQPHIGYTNGTYMRYATRASGLWKTAVVEANLMYANTDTAVALDALSKVYMFFQDSMVSSLRHVTNASGAWFFSTPSGSGGGISLAVDTSGRFHPSYSKDDYLCYDTDTSGSWQTTAVDSVCYSGGHTTLALDGDTKAHIAYFYRCFSNEPGYLKYATNASGSWAAAMVDNSANVGKNTAMTKDFGGRLHAVYYDVTDGDLKYATNAPGAWAVSTIDTGGDVGQYASIAVASGDNLHVAYYDATDGNLKYAFRRSSPKGNIDGAGDVTLADAVIALHAVARMDPNGIRANYASSGADVNGDNAVGLAEAIHALQVISGLR